MTTNTRKRLPRANAITVEATAEVIANAQRNNSSHCIYADAIRAQFPHFLSVNVDLQTVRFTDPTKNARFIYLTPISIQNALNHFDDTGIRPEPFTFRLSSHMAQVVPSQAGIKPRGSRKIVRTSNGTCQISGGCTPPRAPSFGTATPSKLGRGTRRERGMSRPA